MPPDLSGGASACVRDIRRGFPSAASSFVDSVPLPISIANTTSTVSPGLSISSDSTDSDYISSSSISSQSSVDSLDSPPQYTDLFPPSPPVTPLGFPSRSVPTAAAKDASLIALSRVSLGGRTLSACSTSTTGSTLSLVSEASSIADTDVSTADLDAENDTQSIDSSSPSEIAHDLAATIFPSLDLSGRAGVECSAIPVEVTSSSEEWAAWDGFVLDHAKNVDGQEEGEVRTLYVKSRNYDGVNARENVIALLELADEAMECDSVVICLDKTNPDLSSTLHSLLYVGGSIVHADASQGVEFMHSADFVLVGLDL